MHESSSKNQTLTRRRKRLVLDAQTKRMPKIKKFIVIVNKSKENLIIEIIHILKSSIHHITR